MSAKATAVLVAAVFLSGLVVGWVLARRAAPELLPPQIRYVDRLVPVERLVQKVVSVPEVRYVTKEVERLRIDTVYVPVELQNYVLADRSPIVVTPRRVSFDYFDPNSRSWVRDEFPVPSPRMRWGLYAGLGGDWVDLRTRPDQPTVDLSGVIGSGRIDLVSQLSQPLGRHEPLRVRVGVRYRLAGN